MGTCFISSDPPGVAKCPRHVRLELGLCYLVVKRNCRVSREYPGRPERVGRLTCWAVSLGLGAGPGGLCPLSLGQARWDLGAQGAMTVLPRVWYGIDLRELTDDLERWDGAQRGKGTFLGKHSE